MMFYFTTYLHTLSLLKTIVKNQDEIIHRPETWSTNKYYWQRHTSSCGGKKGQFREYTL